MGTENLPLILGISGASGSLYGMTLAGKILAQGIPLHLLISSVAEEVITGETGQTVSDWLEELSGMGRITREDPHNLGAAISSGSYLTRGMIIAPCSMGTLGRIAAGISSNLTERAADVCLKERRPLVLLARETPLSAIHLENMLRITHAGGIIMPPVPALYARPEGIQEMVDHTADRVLDLVGLSAPSAYRWTGDAPTDD